jgi:hypothetical protein
MGEGFFFYQQAGNCCCICSGGNGSERVGSLGQIGPGTVETVTAENGSELANEYNVVASVDNYDYENLTNE